MNSKKDLIFDIICNIVIFLLWGIGIFVLIYGIVINNISLIIIWSVVSAFDTWQVIKHIKNLIEYRNERKKLIQKYTESLQEFNAIFGNKSKENKMTENRCIMCNEIIPEGIDVCPNCQAQVNKGETK